MTTAYDSAKVDVREGPLVIELKTPDIGIVDNASFPHVGNLGIGGPDKGKRWAVSGGRTGLCRRYT